MNGPRRGRVRREAGKRKMGIGMPGKIGRRRKRVRRRKHPGDARETDHRQIDTHFARSQSEILDRGSLDFSATEPELLTMFLAGPGQSGNPQASGTADMLGIIFLRSFTAQCRHSTSRTQQRKMSPAQDECCGRASQQDYRSEYPSVGGLPVHVSWAIQANNRIFWPRISRGLRQYMIVSETFPVTRSALATKKFQPLMDRTRATSSMNIYTPN